MGKKKLLYMTIAEIKTFWIKPRRHNFELKKQYVYNGALGNII